jgi:hypothetical protein
MSKERKKSSVPIGKDINQTEISIEDSFMVGNESMTVVPVQEG